MLVTTPTDTSLPGIRSSIERQLVTRDIVTLTRGQAAALLGEVEYAAVARPLLAELTKEPTT